MLRLADERPEPGRESGPPELQARHAAFTAAGLVDTLRVVGQRLAGVLVQFLLGVDPPRHMAEARAIGREYAVACLESGLSTSEAVHAFLYYRNRFTDALGPAGSEEDVLERHRRYDAFVGEVLLGFVDEPGSATVA